MAAVEKLMRVQLATYKVELADASVNRGVCCNFGLQSWLLVCKFFRDKILDPGNLFIPRTSVHTWHGMSGQHVCAGIDPHSAAVCASVIKGMDCSLRMKRATHCRTQ